MIDHLKSKALSALLLGAALSPAPTLEAQWAWAKTEATAALSGDQVVAAFTFQNKGTRPIAVTELKFSCSCTDFSFKSTTAPPGGSGIVRIFLTNSIVEETRELVAFGTEETTPTPLTIRIPKPANLPGRDRKR